MKRMMDHLWSSSRRVLIPQSKIRNKKLVRQSDNIHCKVSFTQINGSHNCRPVSRRAQQFCWRLERFRTGRQSMPASLVSVLSCKMTLNYIRVSPCSATPHTAWGVEVVDVQSSTNVRNIVVPCDIDVSCGWSVNSMSFFKLSKPRIQFSRSFISMSLLGGPPEYAQNVSVEQLRSELAHVSVATVMCGAHTVAFQPSCHPEYRIEDRHLVEDWELANGTWKFIGVFDGARVARV